MVIGETGVLNQKLRFEDEFVRHKILDAIGDLSLLGYPLVGHLEASKAGHALHAALARKCWHARGLGARRPCRSCRWFREPGLAIDRPPRRCRWPPSGALRASGG